MRHLTSLVFTSILCFAAPDVGRAGGSAVAEIVTFKLVDGADEAAFVEAAHAMEPFLTSSGAMQGRTLSKGPDGVWTDHIVWSSGDAALNAAQEVMDLPEAAPFMGMIDGASVTMTHAPVLLRQD